MYEIHLLVFYCIKADYFMKGDEYGTRNWN
jgi:hypothetical protein